MPGDHILSSVLLQVLSNRIGWQGLDRRSRSALTDLAEVVTALSTLFTKNRQALDGRYFMDSRLLHAYLAYFLPVNAAKIQSILNELPKSDAVLMDNGALRVLDVGSGPGTGALAVLDWLQQSERAMPTLDVTLIDGVHAALEEAQHLWQAYCRMADLPSARFHCRQLDLERNEWMKFLDSTTPFHLIIVANTLNEVHRQSKQPLERHVQLIHALLGRLHPHGSLILMEPALKTTSRGLHALRDRLLALNACTVYTPCLHERPCPALMTDDDWCHEERPWTPPEWISAVDNEVGFIKDAVKFSYVVLRKDGVTIVRRNEDVFRVVSELRTMKGDSRAWLCNHTGRIEVGRLDRDETASNAAVRMWHRGAIVQIDRIEKKTPTSIGRIKAHGRADIVRSV